MVCIFLGIDQAKPWQDTDSTAATRKQHQVVCLQMRLLVAAANVPDDLITATSQG
jgi:hypothetical protein